MNDTAKRLRLQAQVGMFDTPPDHKHCGYSEAADRIEWLEQEIKDFLYALDRGYLACKDDSAFIDALREAVK